MGRTAQSLIAKFREESKELARAADQFTDRLPAEIANDKVFRVKFTEVQRKVIADLHPELTSRLKLSEKNQRVVELRHSELDGIVHAAREALVSTKGPRRTALKKIIEIGDISSDRKRGTPSPVAAATIYQFKITLKDSRPPIWRRIQTEDCSLAKLHYLIQSVMGWHDSHLHEFNIAGERYAAPPPFVMGPDDFDAIDASTIKLSELIDGGKKFRCEYIYDYGDCWEHLIELEKIIPAESKTKYPRCIDGERACPPEDCGGIWGFYDFVAAMSDRTHPEHHELKEWYGGFFKPDAFNNQKATREMRRWAK